MWQNTCLSLSCKTSLYYNAIYFTKVSYTVLVVFHKCFELIQWAMYMGRHASSANIANITVSRAPGFSEPFIQKSALCRGWLRLIWNYWGVNFAAVLFKLLFASLALHWIALQLIQAALDWRSVNHPIVLHCSQLLPLAVCSALCEKQTGGLVEG